MNVAWLLATLHLLALGIGLGAVYARARALRGTLDQDGLRRVFLCDNWWGVAGGLFLVTGVLRAFFGFAKGTEYYLANGLFHAKLGLFVLILLLEIWPMMTFIRWRMQMKRGDTIDTSRARAFAGISHAQMGLILIILFLATAIARGL